jgi:hypothetical protein
MTQISEAIQRFESKPIHEHCIPATDMSNMEQARLMYNELYDDCLTEGLPLTKLTDLAANESCILETYPETETIIDTISHAIMRRLTAFKLCSHIWEQKKGSFFTGVFVPQKSVLLPPIKTQCKPFQKHVSSYQVKSAPAWFVWTAPTLLTRAIIKNRP